MGILRKCLAVTGLFGLAAASTIAADSIILKIKVQTATIRSAPDFNSSALGIKKIGELLEATAKLGIWYEIPWITPEGYAIKGYLAESLVEVVRPGAAPGTPAPNANPPTAAPATANPKPPGQPAASKKGLGGLVVKFGVRDIGVGGWLGSLGFDLGLGRFLALGLEALPTVWQYSDDSIKLKSTVILANGFLNLKVGTRLGIISPAWDFVRVYAGGGGGGRIMYSKLSSDQISGTLTQKVLAAHILGGFEIKMKKWSLVFEYQTLKAFQPHYSQNAWVGYFFFGVRI